MKLKVMIAMIKAAHFNRLRRACGAVLVLAGSILADSQDSVAQDTTRVKAGLEVWKNAGCADCHGSFADGDKQRDEAPSGPSLRTARLDAPTLKEVISCGRPGGAGMPAFDEGAYK